MLYLIVDFLDLFTFFTFFTIKSINCLVWFYLVYMLIKIQVDKKTKQKVIESFKLNNTASSESQIDKYFEKFPELLKQQEQNIEKLNNIQLPKWKNL